MEIYEMMDWGGSGFGLFMMFIWVVFSILVLVLMVLAIIWLAKEVRNKK